MQIGVVGLSLVGCFTQPRHCKARAYATIFSLGISQMSRQAKADMMGGINLHWGRHGGARGAWNGASLGSNSCICLGSLNEALTCQANLSMSSSRTVDSSAHQLGTSHLSSLPSYPVGRLRCRWLWWHFFVLLLRHFRQSLQEGSYFCPELWWFPQVWVSAFRPHSARGHIRVSGSATCMLATEAGLMSLFPAPFFRSVAIPTSPFRTGMAFLPMQPFDLFFQELPRLTRLSNVLCTLWLSLCLLSLPVPIETVCLGQMGAFGAEWSLDVRSALLLQWMTREDGWYLFQNGWFSWWRTRQPV